MNHISEYPSFDHHADAIAEFVGKSVDNDPFSKAPDVAQITEQENKAEYRTRTLSLAQKAIQESRSHTHHYNDPNAPKRNRAHLRASE